MKKAIPLFCLWLCLVAAFCPTIYAETKVQLTKIPDDGIQPRVKVDPSGVVHLIYYKGDATSGNLFYCAKTPGGNFSAPVQVNSIADSAIAKGTIRGAKSDLLLSKKTP